MSNVKSRVYDINYVVNSLFNNEEFEMHYSLLYIRRSNDVAYVYNINDELLKRIHINNVRKLDNGKEWVKNHLRKLDKETKNSI